MIFRLNLEKAVFKLSQNLTSKLQFNGFLFSGRMVFSCSWWRSHHCLWLLLWTFNLFRLMFLVYLSQGLHVPSFYTCLTLRRLFSDESTWIVHGTLWCVQWRRMTPSYLLFYLTSQLPNIGPKITKEFKKANKDITFASDKNLEKHPMSKQTEAAT